MPDPKYTGIADSDLPRGRVRVVNKKELDAATERGAHLLRVLPTQNVVITLSDEHGLRCEHCGNHMQMTNTELRCYSCRKIGAMPKATTHVVDTHEYLVLDEVDQVYEELRRDAERAQRQANESYRKASDATAAQKVAEELAASRLKELKSAQDGCFSREQQLNSASDRLQKMETDLAKVRQAIGDHKWKEIIG